jgi:hypothetical protein
MYTNDTGKMNDFEDAGIVLLGAIMGVGLRNLNMIVIK